MAAGIVSVKSVVDELEGLMDESVAYLNRKTGELYTVMPDVAGNGEDYEDEPLPDDIPAWQKEAILKAREIEESPDWVPLPSKHDIHEYAIMERFAVGYPDANLSERLCGAIRGSGAFQRFKALIRQRHIEQDWFRYRERAMGQIVMQWLDDLGIPYDVMPEHPG